MNDKNIEEKGTKTVKERVLEYERFKESVIEYLSKRDNPDKVFLYIGEKGYSCNDLIKAINKGSEDGLSIISSTFKLALDLLVRDNLELKKKYSLLPTLTQYKEALRELVDKVNMLTYSIVEEERDVNNNFFSETMDSLAKAKQLLNNE